MSHYLFPPPPVAALPIRGQSELFPVNRLFFVGRNYHAHAMEMVGKEVDKANERAFYFTKAPSTLTLSGATIPYPPETQNYHYEMELVVALGKGGFRVSEAQADAMIFGYACGLDMTRRDLQLVAREKGRPWDLGKDIEHGSICSDILAMPGKVIESGKISLTVNGETRQSSDVNKLIWNVREIIADLSLYYHLQPGDIIYTGTPEGVGPVKAGDVLAGEVEGVGTVGLTIGQPE